MLLTLTAALVTVLAVRGYGYHTEQRLAQSVLPDLQLAERWADWQVSAQAEPIWRPDFPAADLMRFESYRSGKRQVDLFIAFFTHQRQGYEVSNSTNRFADEETWVRAASGRREAIVDGKPTVLRYERVKSGSDQRLVWYWYWVDGRFTANPYLAKLLETRAKLLGGKNAAAVVAVATVERDGETVAAGDLSAFLGDVQNLRDVLDGRGGTLAEGVVLGLSPQPGES